MTLAKRAFALAALLSTAAIPTFAETPDDQLVVGFSMTNVLTLDPAAITGREPVQILANVYDGLVSLDAKDRAKVNPDLAESPLLFPDEETFARLHAFATLNEDVEAEYDAAFSDITGA